MHSVAIFVNFVNMNNYNVIILVIFSLYNVTILYYNVTIANNEFFFFFVDSMSKVELEALL